MAFMAGSLVMAAGIRGFFGSPDVAMPIAGYVALGHLGAGFAATVDIVTHHAEVAPLIGKLSVGQSVALYMLGLWLVRDRYLAAGRNVLPVAAAAALVASFLPFAIEAMALVSIAAVIARERLTPARSRALSAQPGLRPHPARSPPLPRPRNDDPSRRTCIDTLVTRRAASPELRRRLCKRCHRKGDSDRG